MIDFALSVGCDRQVVPLYHAQQFYFGLYTGDHIAQNEIILEFGFIVSGRPAGSHPTSVIVQVDIVDIIDFPLSHFYR